MTEPIGSPPRQAHLHIVRPYLYPMNVISSRASLRIVRPYFRGGHTSIGDGLLYATDTGSHLSQTYTEPESSAETYVISNYDGIGEPLFPRPTTTEARRGIQQLGKGLFKHPKKVDEKYPAWPPRETEQEKIDKEVLNTSTAEVRIAAIIEEEGRPHLNRPCNYHIPLNRPSFHRIVRLFFQMEQELYQRELDGESDSSSPPSRISKSGEAESPNLRHEKRPKRRRLSSLRISEGTTEHPSDTVADLPTPIIPYSIPHHISYPYDSSEDVTQPSIARLSGTRDDLSTSHSIHSRDFAHPMLYRNALEARLSQAYEIPSPSHLHPGSSHASLRTKDSVRPLRTSDGTQSTYGEAGTEGSVMNAPFMPDNQHTDPISLHELEKWNRPFWERYRPWEVICAISFVALIFAAAGAILGVWIKKRIRISHGGFDQYVKLHSHGPDTGGKMEQWNGHVNAPIGGGTAGVPKTQMYGGGQLQHHRGGPTQASRGGQLQEGLPPQQTTKGKPPLPDGVKKALETAEIYYY